MKKTFMAIALCLVCATTFTSCNNRENTSNEKTAVGDTITVIEEQPIDSSYIENGDFASKSFSTETVDEFGEKTGDIKIGYLCGGKFSNSATTNSEAILQIGAYPSKKKIYFTLYEYAGNHPSSDHFMIEMENEKGEKIKIDEYNFSTNYNKFYNFMCNSSDVKIKMKEVCEYYITPTTAIFRIFNPKEFVKMFDEYNN